MACTVAVEESISEHYDKYDPHNFIWFYQSLQSIHPCTRLHNDCVCSMKFCSMHFVFMDKFTGSCPWPLLPCPVCTTASWIFALSALAHRLGEGRGTPIYFLHGDFPLIRVSFSGFSVLNRVYNFTFLCLKQGRHHKSPPFLPFHSHNFRWICAPSLKCMKKQTTVMYCFEYSNACSSLEQGKKLQHLLLDRVAKFTFVASTGSGFYWVDWTPLPKFLLSTPSPGGSLLFPWFLQGCDKVSCHMPPLPK